MLFLLFLKKIRATAQMSGHFLISYCPNVLHCPDVRTAHLSTAQMSTAQKS